MRVVSIPASVAQVQGTAPASTPGAPSLPALHVGQEISANVLAQTSDGHFLIDVEGVQLDALAPQGLPVGSALALRVQQLQPKLILEVGGEGPSPEIQAVRLLRTSLEDQVPLAQAPENVRQAEAQGRDLSAVQALIERLLPGHNSPNAEQLQAFVRDGGLHYEAKLARAVPEGPQALGQVAAQDLKGVLLRAVADAKATPATGSAPDAAGFLAGHLSHIESLQALNLLAQARQTPYLLHLPFVTGQGLATAMVAVEADAQSGKEKEEQTQAHNLFFQVNLEGFGQLRIDAHAGTEALRAVFYVEQPQGLDRLQAEIPGFQERLQSLGYREVLLAAKPLDQVPAEKQQKFAAWAAGVPSNLNLVDARA
jgi:hypothetical protein